MNKYCVVGDSALAADLRAAGCVVTEVHHNAAFNVVVAEMLQIDGDPSGVQCVIVGNDQRALDLSQRVARMSVAPILMLAGDSEPFGILDSHGVMHLPLETKAPEIMQCAYNRMGPAPFNGSNVGGANQPQQAPTSEPSPVVLSGPLHEAHREAAPIQPHIPPLAATPPSSQPTADQAGTTERSPHDATLESRSAELPNDSARVYPSPARCSPGSTTPSNA